VINLVSRVAVRPTLGGTSKVFRNLIKGLDRLAYPYVVNRRLDSCRRLWVQDDLRVLRFLPGDDVRIVIGPSMYPFNLPSRQLGDKAVFVYPSEWPEEHWSAVGFAVRPSAHWPVGVDLDEFPERRPGHQTTVLVYYKHRRAGDLEQATGALESRRVPYRVLRYGQYTEPQFRELLHETGFAVWVSGTESQGLAMLEAMASGVPIVVFDCTRLSQNWATDLDFARVDASVPVTSAPYFDERCGLKTSTRQELGHAIDVMMDTWRSYTPRAFVRERLDLEGQARKFVDLWGRWGLTFEDGLRERPRCLRQLRLPPTWIAHAVVRRLRSRRYFRRMPRAIR
jgi:hypothetical protein